MEALHWKILVEEPGGCCMIANAPNSGNELALRTTELTAISVLAGECALQAKLQDSKEVSFLKVKAKMRSELDTIVDEADFQELFEFVINLGASTGPFIADLIDFGEKFVNQKTRQLRLAAFAIINQMSNNYPRLKVAALKRSYRKSPTYGICPSPEPKFHSASHEYAAAAEEALHYFHGYHKAAVAAFGRRLPATSLPGQRGRRNSGSVRAARGQKQQGGLPKQVDAGGG